MNTKIKGSLCFLVVFLAGFTTKASFAIQADPRSADSQDTIACNAQFWFCGFGCDVTPVQCNNGRKGFIHSKVPLNSLKVVVTKKRSGEQQTYLLPNPPGNIQDYKDVDDNEWVLSNLPSLKRRDKVEVANLGFGVPANTTLYEDIFGDRPKGPIGQGAKKTGISSCTYTTPPMVAKIDKCGTICMVRGECYIKGIKYTNMDFVCKAKKGETCPQAKKCAVDDKELPLLAIASNYDFERQQNLPPKAKERLRLSAADLQGVSRAIQ